MKTHINIKHYLAFTIVACWAIGTTVLSYDRILYHASSYVAYKSNQVAVKYAPQIEIKETVIYKEPSYAANMPPKLPINQVYNRAIGE